MLLGLVCSIPLLQQCCRDAVNGVDGAAPSDGPCFGPPRPHCSVDPSLCQDKALTQAFLEIRCRPHSRAPSWNQYVPACLHPLLMQVSPFGWPAAGLMENNSASCQGERETKRWRTTVHGEKEVDEGRGLWEP